jgi:CDP-glucose 4,6-dehydratase
VLVTGGTGLLGGWLVRRLAAHGAAVVCLVRDWVPRAELLRLPLPAAVILVRGDVEDREVLERALGEYEIATVFHLAAQTIVQIANRNPISTFATNIGGTWALLEACRRSPTVKEVVLASSDKAYGEHERLPYDEDAALQGRYPYDVSKSCADLLGQSYAATYRLPVVITRCGNFFGGGDLNFNRVVPGTIRSVLYGERPVVRSDGTLVRDYLYVEDAAEAYLLLAETLAEQPALAGQAFNFSNEEALAVSEVVRRILVVMGSTLEPLVLGEASNEIPRQHLCAAKARQVLGWQPLFAFEDGMRRTVAWYSEFLGLGRL